LLLKVEEEEEEEEVFFVARQVDKRETSTKTCNETMLRDKSRVLHYFL